MAQASTQKTAVDIVRKVSELRARVEAWRRDGLTIGLIPTMGALHEGHLSLVRAALNKYDRAVVTLFINPRQFNSVDDLAKYPRTENDDAVKLAAAHAHLLYAPGPDEMYPEGYSTNICVSGISTGLCGADRPGHFDGVATVCTKLFLQSGADGAFFGEKDFQQLQVVQRFVRDLDIPITIHPCETVREADGLALSSRNERLSSHERQIAPSMYATMQTAALRLRDGDAVVDVLREARLSLESAGFGQIDYLELRSSDNLATLDFAMTGAQLFAAAWLGDVRLIDNTPV